MIVMGKEGVGHLAKHLRQDLLSSISDPHMLADLRLMAVCIDLISEDFDRAVDVLAADREDLCVIFRQAAAFVDAPFRAALRERLEIETKGLRVAALMARSDRDMSVMIELHQQAELAEQNGKAWAAELNSLIWRFIEDYAARRAYQSPV